MPPDAPPIVARYREVRIDGKRHFELFNDAIRVHGTATFQSDIDTTIPLADIQPRIIRLRIRHRAFWTGLWITIGGTLGFITLVAGFQLDPMGLAPGLLGCIGAGGVLTSLATLRKVEFARFESKAGVAVLDVARAGPDKGSYDEFVARIMEQIEASQKSE